MTRRPRILFSTRDPGSAGHILALVEAFSREPRFDVDVAASGIGLQVIQRAGKSPYPFILADGRDHLEYDEDPSPLITEAEQLLGRVEPDAVIAGLSSLGVGVDEAVLAAARVPTFAMQDFWGDVNLGLGIPAGLYFVIDEEAATLTRQRWGVEALVVGSPKHARYSTFNVQRLRQAGREFLGVREDEKVIGFFGQSPAIAGHAETFQDLVAAVARIRAHAVLLLREHPKFPGDSQADISLACRHGLRVTDVTNQGDPETWLASCDVVTTPFSAAGFDHAYLSAYSAVPIGTVLYLMSNADLRDFASRVSGMKELPSVRRGIGGVVDRREDLLTGLESALTREKATAYFEASKSLAKGDPVEKIIETVEQRLSARAGL